MASTTLQCMSLTAKSHVSGSQLQSKRTVKNTARSKAVCVATLEVCAQRVGRE